MKQMTYDAVQEAIERAQHILLVTDERSDGDTFGSSLAFRAHLEGKGAQVSHYASSPILESLQFLPGIHGVARDHALLEDPSVDLVIVFDSSREEFVKKRLAFHARRTPLIVFDHHASNAHFGDLNLVDPEASSTCEIVYDYLRHHRADVTPDIAKCLIAGMMTDTGMLTNDATSVVALAKASQLLMAGGSMKDVVKHVMRSVPIEVLRLWGRVLERLVHVPEHSTVVAYVTQEDLDATGTDEKAISELSDYFGSTLDANLVVVLKDLPSRPGVKVSMRAHGVDSTKISKRFPGGGGHPGASGFTVQGKLEVKDGIPQIV